MRKTICFQETKQLPELESEMTHPLEVADRKLKCLKY